MLLGRDGRRLAKLLCVGSNPSAASFYTHRTNSSLAYAAHSDLTLGLRAEKVAALPPGLVKGCVMTEEKYPQQTDRPNDRPQPPAKRWSRKSLLTVITLSVGAALACFIILAFLPSSKQPFFDSPLKSALTGLGLLGIAGPFLIAGTLLNRRAASSPYYEETFIAAVVLLIGLIGSGLGLLCIGLSVYALIMRFIGGK